MSDLIEALSVLALAISITVVIFIISEIVDDNSIEKELLQLQIEEKRLNIELLKKGVCVNGL